MPRNRGPWREVDACRRRIVRCAQTRYHDSVVAAEQYLNVIDQASPCGQEDLFLAVLTNHDAWRRIHTSAQRALCDPGRYKTLVPKCYNWVQVLMRHVCQENLSPSSAALWLWRRLGRRHGHKRVLALAVLLEHPLIPYAQLLPLSVTEPSSTELHQAAASTLSVWVQLRRQLMSTPNARKSSAMFLELLEMINDPIERISLTQRAFLFLQEMAQESGSLVTIQVIK